MAEHRFLFIGGLHRSGTSILFRCLREHPQISGFRRTGVPQDEGQHLQTVYPSGSTLGGPGRFGFSPDAHLDESSLLATGENGKRLFAQWARHWDLRKPVLMEKSPPNLIRSRFLQALFPRAFFLFIIRHPIPVTLSTKRMAGGEVGALLEHWFACHDVFLRDRHHLSRVLAIRFEDFVENPTFWLGAVCSHLGLQSPRTVPTIRLGTNQKHFAAWRRVIARETGLPLAGWQRRAAPFGYSLLQARTVPARLPI